MHFQRQILGSRSQGKVKSNKEKAGQYLASDRPHGNVAKGGGSDTKRKLFDVIEVCDVKHKGE